jgi:hypothetical protein
MKQHFAFFSYSFAMSESRVAGQADKKQGWPVHLEWGMPLF